MDERVACVIEMRFHPGRIGGPRIQACRRGGNTQAANGNLPL